MTVLTALCAVGLSISAHAPAGQLPVKVVLAPLGPLPVLEYTFAVAPDLDVNDAIYVEATDTAYAAVSRTDPVYPNHIVAFHPADREILWSVDVGNEPVVLAAGGTRIYVGDYFASVVSVISVPSKRTNIGEPVVESLAIPRTPAAHALRPISKLSVRVTR